MRYNPHAPHVSRGGRAGRGRGAHGLELNGHTLAWHSQCPDWFFAGEGGPATRGLVLKRLRDHVTTIAGRYAGKVRSWDVLNEAIPAG